MSDEAHAWVWECVLNRHRWVSTRQIKRCPECRTVRIIAVREAGYPKRKDELMSVVSLEARCAKCGEIFNPADENDLIHLMREDQKTECGGQGIMTGMTVSPSSDAQKRAEDRWSRVYQEIPEGHVRSMDLVEAAQISYRQMDYWTRIGLVKAAPRPAGAGSGYPRIYTIAEADVAILAAELVRVGFKPEDAVPMAREMWDRKPQGLDPLPTARKDGYEVIRQMPLPESFIQQPEPSEPEPAT